MDFDDICKFSCFDQTFKNYFICMFFYIEGDSDAVGEQALVEILKKRFLAKKIYVGVQYSNKLSL